LLLIFAGTIVALSTSALASPSFVQANYGAPQTPQTLVAIPYSQAQLDGDLNVVIVGWGDTAAQINSVTDAAGNVYQLAIGPTELSGAGSQAIYYAENIVAAATERHHLAVSGSSTSIT
jgi:hypothetical protein